MRRSGGRVGQEYWTVVGTVMAELGCFAGVGGVGTTCFPIEMWSWLLLRLLLGRFRWFALRLG